MTIVAEQKARAEAILIHTSVKLVTITSIWRVIVSLHFNPHEREARDAVYHLQQVQLRDFNPHEREARDEIC